MRSPAQPAAFPNARAAFVAHWDLYAYEAAELATFMISACLFAVLLFHPRFAPFHNLWLTRFCMGTSMGLTAIAIIKSPWGKCSGAHFNPAISLTFFRLGKIGFYDTVFYVIAHFAGAIAGVALCALVARDYVSAPEVNYVVTVPGLGGVAGAFAAEFFMAALLMAVVLVTSSSRRFASWTTWLMGLLITNYVLLLAPVSGFSINPARTVGSAVFAHLCTALWVYFVAPLAGMFGAAEVFLQVRKPDRSVDRSRAGARSYLAHRHLVQRNNEL